MDLPYAQLWPKCGRTIKSLPHRVLRQAPAVMDKILPIDFAETKIALKTNMESRRGALEHLRNGGAL